jgi:hypothetical protein
MEDLLITVVAQNKFHWSAVAILLKYFLSLWQGILERRAEFHENKPHIPDSLMISARQFNARITVKCIVEATSLNQLTLQVRWELV